MLARLDSALTATHLTSEPTMTLAPLPVRKGRASTAPPEEGPARTPTPAPAAAPAWPGTLTAEELVALAVTAAAKDPDVAAEQIFAAANGSRDLLSAAASVLIERLKLRSSDLEATLALRIIERALVRASYPDGPWRWARDLSPRRMRAVERRRRRAIRRRHGRPRLRDRLAWRSARKTGPTRYGDP